ncbi:FAD:protein FMN transferase [Sporolactobacillus vineae]|uniref:FAD:protein FMN transferase n=1 Tax=Sporolactobacillus vineae TaxID=444463 RepID=UPI0002899AB5|nr:FAD:protein FMN transferase [Sporolactobacillus vineae]
MKKNIMILLLSMALILTGCQPKAQTVKPVINSDPASQTVYLMGTINTIRIYDKGKADVLKPVIQRLRDLAGAVTVEDKSNRSDIDRVNANAGIRPVKVSKDIYHMIQLGKGYAKMSDGYFDITIGPMTKLWHIGFPDARKPSQKEINQTLPLIGYKKMILNDQKQTVFLKQKGMRLDLGGIAKGFITDELVKVLDRYHVHSAIVDLGGNIYVKGMSPTDQEWGVGIQNPFLPRGDIVGKINETNKSIVTAGIYERYLKVDGKVYQHILNPFTGYSLDNDIAGVSVITKKSVDGDALSNVLFVGGVKGGFRLAEKLKGVDAIFVTKGRKVYVTSGLKKNFELTDKSFHLMPNAPGK